MSSMSMLVCHVRRQQPFAVIAMAGTLDKDTLIQAGVTLSDCLAEQPEAVVLDLGDTRCGDERLPAWLHRAAVGSARWPGAPIIVAAPPCPIPIDHDGIVVYDTLAEAEKAAEALPVNPRRAVTLPPTPASCARARDLAQRACTAFGLPRLGQLTQLLASELTANAVTHARTEMELTLRRSGESVIVAVRDGDPRLPHEPGPEDRGAGVELVSAMATDWGSLLTSGGKVVWARASVEKPVRGGHLEPPAGA
ncbi:ATP-binding protein [Catellatospora sp. NPDC049609]|uniref:ATP-binding protein n=1 Tax=Catellatospora sp. NPDC049609 TaxID=3155505 RepID=UPI003435E471